MWHTNKVSFLNLFTLILGAVESSAQSSTQWPQQTFKSTPLEAPYLNVTKNGKTELGYLFFSPSNSNWSYPTIYQDDGQLVWRGPLVNTSAEQPQMLNGEPVLAYWNGANIKGFGFGSISILNSSYDEIYKVTLPGTEEKFVTVLDPVTYPSYIDIHESQITDQGTILVTAVNVTQMDLSSIGGPKDGWVQDGLFYEIDIKTNDVLFRWSTVEHLSEIPLSNNELPLDGKGTNKTTPYEYPHLNSVAKYGDSYLISSRFMCSFFFIDKNGNVTWHLHVSHHLPHLQYYSNTSPKHKLTKTPGPKRRRLHSNPRHKLLLPARPTLRKSNRRQNNHPLPQQRKRRFHVRNRDDNGHDHRPRHEDEDRNPCRQALGR